MRSPTTTTIETVTVIRPLKVLAFLCLIIASVLIVIALCTTAWLKSDGFRTGLFQECVDEGAATPLPSDAPPFGECQQLQSRGKVYVHAVAGLLIIATILCVLGFILTGIGLRVLSNSRKFLFYRCALCLAVVAVLLELVALIMFPICFYFEMSDWKRPRWDFDWAYGIAWGGTLFTFGGCLLLICDKEHAEVYYKEKTIIHDTSLSK